ncbi:ABC transporter permease [Clostridium acetobutylicum]|nr:ABC transporter permease [Clostridium acetobutylicum]
MRILHIAYYSFKKEFKSSIVMMIIFPIALIAILGNSLKSDFSGGISYQENIEVYADNKGSYQEIDNFIKGSEAFRNKINIMKANSNKKAILDLENKKYDAYIHIDHKNMLKLHVKADKINSFDYSIIKNFVYSYAEDLSSKGYKNSNKNTISTINFSNQSFSYYSVTMLVMIILYGTIYGINIISTDRNKNIRERIGSLPIKQSNMVLGKMMGLVLVIILDASIVFLFSKFTYGIDQGNNYIAVLAVIFLYSFFAVGLGMCIELIISSKEVSKYIVEILIPIFTILSGGYVSRRILGDKLTEFSIFSPSYAAQNIIFNAIYGLSINTKMFYIELITLDVILGTLVLVLARRRLT